LSTSTVTAGIKDLQREAEINPDFFWGREAEKLHWFKKWDRVFEWGQEEKEAEKSTTVNNYFRWFSGGLTNLSYNCLDINVKERGRGEKVALVTENERGQRRTFTYSKLLENVKTIAASLRELGVKKGDRVGIYMPTTAEAISAMLATTRIGAIHLVVFAGFGSGALAERLRLAGAKVLLTSDVTWRKGKKTNLWEIARHALDTNSSGSNNNNNREEGATTVEKAVVLVREEEDDEKKGDSSRQLKQGRDITWDEFIEKGKGSRPPEDSYEIMESNEPAYILPTSGTTAKPKLCVHTHGGYQVWIHSAGNWIFGLKPSDVWWSTSDIGWAVGHSYIVYAPLLFGCTTIAYEGALDHPGPETFYGVIERNKVTGLFTAPTAVRLLMRYGTEPSKRFDLSSLERAFSAGEVLNPAAWEWMQKDLFKDRIPVIDHMWQTETGGPIVGNPYGVRLLPIKPGSATLPLPGVSLEVRNENTDGSSTLCKRGEKGIVVITHPFPGLTPTIWGDHERYKRDYWQRIAGVYSTGDAGYIDEDGYVWFSGRSDEIIKVADHRIGPIEVESAFLRHPAVAEVGVTTRPDEIRGRVICAFVVLKPGYKPTEEIKIELKDTVRKELGPVAVIGEMNFISILPKTRSGKIMRRVLKSVVLNQDPGDVSTIEDEVSVEEARRAWMQMREEIMQHHRVVT
jgi:acetyl-CoA synthetase